MPAIRHRIWRVNITAARPSTTEASPKVRKYTGWDHLSATTKLAPVKYASQMLGLWFLATAVGDAIGGQVARLADTWSQPVYFLTFGLASVVLGLAAVMFTRQIRHLMAGIH